MKRFFVCLFLTFLGLGKVFAGCLAISVASQTNLNCFGDSTGSISLSVSGGSSPYTYLWSNGSSSLTGLISGLHEGVIVCTVTDAGLCKDSVVLAITGPTAALSVSCIQQNTSCGKPDGEVTAIVTGGSSPFTYSWSNGGGAGLITGLSPSGYTLTVTDAKGCSSTSSAVIVNRPGPVLKLDSIVNSRCSGSADGYAVIDISSGTPGFTFVWSTGLTGTSANRSDTLLNLIAGTYSLNVSDANGCFAGMPFTINQPALLTTTVTATDGSCGHANGSISVAVSGGAPGYTYVWSNGDTVRSTLPGNLMNGLLSGNFSVTVIDTNGCRSMASASLNNQTALSVIIANQTDVSCSGNSDGIVTVQITSGTPPYSYTWAAGSTSVSGLVSDSTVQISGLAAGSYTLSVQDRSSCAEAEVIVLSQPFELSANITYSDASCGISNGLIDAGASGGTSPYLYNWNIDSTSKIIRNLSAGTYSVTVTDKRGCTAMDSASLVNSTLPVALASAQPADIVAGQTTELNGGGGSSFQWLPGLTVTCSSCPITSANPLKTTTYTLIATDNFGCSDTAKVTVTVKPACLGNESDVFIANVFSPNGDGKNDVIKIDGNGLASVSWSIFDRWGNLLFYTEDQSEGWDGTSAGKALANGTYVYILNATCQKTQQVFTMKGNISILK